MRTNFDFSPYRRSTIGFDRLFDLLESSARSDTPTYPPFDIEMESEDRYRITLAVPGFAPEEIEIIAQNNVLSVSGRKDEADRSEAGKRYLHRGIPTGSFERKFQLADFVVVEDARFEDGLLRVSLKREIPEAMKPRKIAIGGADKRADAAGALKEPTQRLGNEAAAA